MKNFIITGGAGFLGSHLCDQLLRTGNQVTCIDNLSTGSINNIKHLHSNKNFKFIEHDIINKIQFNTKIDFIFNLACPASPPQYQNDPIQTFKTSVIGSINLLEKALENDAKIFQASTSEVYGDPMVHPQIESYFGNVNTIGIRSCYDEGKRAAETCFFDYKRKHNLDIKVVRIFNTYGPRMSPQDGRVVSNFIYQALNNIPLTIYGDGSQTRSFCYVEDMIDAFIKTSESDSSICGPINLGNPEENTILSIAQMIISLCESQSEIIFKELPQDDPRQRQPDITKAKHLLSWEPHTELNEGLKKTINYFKNI